MTETVDTGDLLEPEVRVVSVDGRQLRVAFADQLDDRVRGLMGVADLGELDGMMFDLGSERVQTFTMENTLIPLDIFFFDAEGRLVGSIAMQPCVDEPCSAYSIDTPSRYAIEVPAGSVNFPEGALLSSP